MRRLTDRRGAAWDHPAVVCSWLVGVVVVGLTSAASATPPGATLAPRDGAWLTLDELWPGVPADTAPSLEQRITAKVADAGNHLGDQLDEASHHRAGFRIDGRTRRARVHLGGGDEHLIVSLDSNVMFEDGKAIIKAKLQLALHGHHLVIELPDIDVRRDSYRNEGMTAVNVSVLEHQF